MRRNLQKTLALLLSAAMLAAVSPAALAADADEPAATAAAEPAPEITPRPEAFPKPEKTSAPKETPAAEDVPETEEASGPEKMPEPEVTPEPTEAPEAAEFPEPTEAPEPTETPEPTEAPEPTETPEPAESPEPTETLEPTESPEPTATPEPELEALETRETAVEPSEYFPVLTEGLPFPQALDALLDGLVQTLVLTEAEQSAEKEIEEITLAYGNGTLTDNMDALPFIAAAFAAKTGKTADELTEADLTAKELSVLRTVFGAMSAVSCTLMETDMTDGTLNDETGEPNVIKTKYALSFKILLSRSASALLVTAEEQERYQALCTGDEWDKLLSLWRGYGWVESGAGERVYTLREDVIRLALAQQGRIEYLWGGKYNNLGRSPFWGFPQQNENGEIFTDGLDCSGFVTWVLLNAAGTVEALPTIGEGTSVQRLACEAITREELRPGDLVFGGEGTAETDHVGIVTGFADDGRVLMCHCMRGGVTLSYAEDFGMDNYYRPAAYYAAYETPETLPEISVTEYAGSEDGAVYLVKVAAEPGTRCRWTLDGAEMLYSETYGAWCALTTANDAAARVSRVRCSGGSDTVCYDGDVNGSGVTEINDAQRIYSISCGQQRFETKNAEAWLKADLNGDGRITAEDASEILRLI